MKPIYNENNLLKEEKTRIQQLITKEEEAQTKNIDTHNVLITKSNIIFFVFVVIWLKKKEKIYIFQMNELIK